MPCGTNSKIPIVSSTACSTANTSGTNPCRPACRPKPTSPSPGTAPRTPACSSTYTGAAWPNATARPCNASPGCTTTSRCPMPCGMHSIRSEEHTSALQSLMRISYAVFCFKKKNHNTPHGNYERPTPNLRHQPLQNDHNTYIAQTTLQDC